MSSALSITQSVNPPRAVFVDFPLGHTAGRPADPVGQLALMRETLASFESLGTPGQVYDLNLCWAEDDAWKEALSSATDDAGDSRVERHPTPQYQSAEDERLALAAGACSTCIEVEPTA